MSTDFIRAKVAADTASGKYGGRVVTRFPPEPNGFPHIGHAKSMALNFGIAQEFGGRCHLRFDDTNPEKEDVKYVEAMLRDVAWLGYEPGVHVYYASDYYESLYESAIRLIEKGLAYVCPLNEEEIRAWRGTVSEPGRPSPGRDRSVEENLDLFRRMRAGEFPDGAYTLRARIDMTAANMKLRDPLLYRIRHVTHYRTGDAWCIYPMYDYAHPLSDAIEGITHSLCTLEFENNRDIYDWLMRSLEIPTPPEQTEFARLALNWTVMSKRRLLQLVKEGLVDGWDDPRMPTLSGMRRRGYTPTGIRTFSERIGVARANSTVDFALLEECIRDDLNPVAPRVLCVLNPLKVTLTTWPEGCVEWLEAPSFPKDIGGDESRAVPFTRELYIERDDFAEVPPPGWHRLTAGGEVRLRHGYVIRCDEVVKDAAGQVVELRCSHDRGSRHGRGGKRVKGTLHWVSATEGRRCVVNLYDRLFTSERPGEDRPFEEDLNPASLTRVTGAWIEPSVETAEADTRYQFERLGYFWRDPGAEGLVFNRIVALKDSWAKQAAAEPTPEPTFPPPPPPPASRQVPLAPGSSSARKALDPEVEARRAALVRAGVTEDDAVRIADDAELTTWFQAAATTGAPPAELGRWVVNDVARDAKAAGLAALRVTPSALGELVKLQCKGVVTNAAARVVYGVLAEAGGDPAAIVEARGLAVVADPAALAPLVARVLADNAGMVDQYRGGKTQLLGFFVGQVLRASGGRAAAEVVRAEVERALRS